MSLVLNTGGLFPGARQVYEQLAMAEAEQNGALLSSRGTGLPTETGDCVLRN